MAATTSGVAVGMFQDFGRDFRSSNYRSIVTRLQAQGYETLRLVRTLQVAAPPVASAARAPEGS